MQRKGLDYKKKNINNTKVQVLDVIKRFRSQVSVMHYISMDFLNLKLSNLKNCNNNIYTTGQATASLLSLATDKPVLIPVTGISK